MNLWQTLEALWKLSSLAFWVPTINEVTQPAVAALFVNRLPPEISGLIKMQKKDEWTG